MKEGWKPLCDFLGVPVPDKPFPRVNSTEEWKMKVSVIMKGNVQKALKKVLLAAIILGCGYFLLQSFFGF